MDSIVVKIIIKIIIKMNRIVKRLEEWGSYLELGAPEAPRERRRDTQPTIMVNLRTELVDSPVIELRLLRSYAERFKLSAGDTLFIDHQGFRPSGLVITFRGRPIMPFSELSLDAYSYEEEQEIQERLSEIRAHVMTRDPHIIKLNDLEYDLDTFLESYNEADRRYLLEVIQDRLEREQEKVIPQ